MEGGRAQLLGLGRDAPSLLQPGLEQALSQVLVDLQGLLRSGRKHQHVLHCCLLSAQTPLLQMGTLLFGFVCMKTVERRPNLGSTVVLPISNHTVRPSFLLSEALQLQHPPGAAAALRALGLFFFY